MISLKRKSQRKIKTKKKIKKINRKIVCKSLSFCSKYFRVNPSHVVSKGRPKEEERQRNRSEKIQEAAEKKAQQTKRVYTRRKAKNIENKVEEEEPQVFIHLKLKIKFI